MAADASTVITAHGGASERDSGELLFSIVARLGHGFEDFGLESAIALQQDFNLAFGFFEFLAAGTGQLHALVKKLQRPVEGNIPFF